ncbi:hypothetical protein EDC01DRAFT_628656 [Geopyxis carbonaria]|nr:hypothetical protein EDC01DRAFT_628656 [Geopyxis carbonaria]
MQSTTPGDTAEEESTTTFLEATAPMLKASARKTARKASVLDQATGLDKIVASTGDLTDQDVYLLRKLTTAMVWVHQPSHDAVKEVFFWLQKIQGKPPILKVLTPYAWKFLWALETSPIPSFRTRLIGDLMVAAGAPFSEEQEIAYIGGLFWNEAREQAIERWRRLVKDNTSPAVWNLGVRMFALEQKPEMAQEIIKQMIRELGYTEHKTWIPVVLSYNHIYENEKAWDAYLKLRFWAEKNSMTVTAAQFDDLAMSFLDSNQPSMGLEVYKHMVFLGFGALDRQQTETYRNLATAVKEAQNSAKTPDSLNKLSLDALQTLPAHVADKYFYGGWMRNLMKMGRTDLAYFLIREVMFSKGHPPDSIHVNWVIQGFLEEGNVKAAEKLADEMIKRRLYAIGKAEKDETMVHDPEGKLSGINITGDIRLPPATIQTFSILINYFSRRQKMDQIVILCARMRQCEIPANSYIMNHMLYALFRVHDMPRLASSFDSMTHGDIVPDCESFLVMWMAMFKSYTHNRRRYPEFLTPRDLFKRTFQALSKSQRSENHDKMVRIWHYVIKSFMLDRDLEGGLLALHAGKKVWDLPIDETIVREIAFGVLKARPWDPRKTQAEKPRITPHTMAVSVDTLKLLGESLMLARRRKRGPLRSRTTIPKLDPHDSSLESLTLLLSKELGNSNLTLDDLKRARADMGVNMIDLGIL